MSLQEEQLELQKKKKKNLKPSDFGPEVEELYREVRECWEDNKLQRRTIKQKANEIAERIAESNRKDGKPEEENKEICEIICDWYQADGSLQRHIERVLPKEFKREYNSTTINRPDVVFNECFTKSSRFVKYLEELKNEDPYTFGRGGAQDIAQLLKVVKDKIDDWAEKAKVPLPYQRSDMSDDDDYEPTHLQPAEVPKSERLRLLQQLEGKLLYARGRHYTKLGDSVTKMNFISDNPKLNERILCNYLRETLICHSVTIEVLVGFLQYFEKFKTKETLTKEDKDIIRSLWSILIQISSVESWDNIKDLYTRFEEKERAYRAARSVELHDTLSDSA